jgi:fructokinase
MGEALMDCVIASSGEPLHEVPGGSPMNVAIGLGRLGHPALLAARVGDDARGAAIVSHVKGSGVAVIDAISGLTKTPTASARLQDDGSAAYEFDLEWDLTPEMVAPAGYLHVHTGSIGSTLHPGASAVLEILTRERLAGASISYDPNVRPHIMGSADGIRDQMEAIIAISDLVKASDEDVAWLYPSKTPTEVVEHWKKLGALLVVITQGEKGATAWGSEGSVSLPTRAKSVIDTIGAGDTVMAALIYALATRSLLGGVHRGALGTVGEDELSEIVAFALRAAAITVARSGADLPTLADIEEEATHD